MTNTIETVMDRVRKLLRLSERAGSEHEAALAAQRAAELLAEHNLSEAQIRLEEPERPREGLVEERVADGQRKVAWRGQLAHAVAASYGARMHWNKNWRSDVYLVFFGRQSAVQASIYTTQYLLREVDRLAAQAVADAKSESPRAYGNSFRLGCVAVIAERLRALQGEQAAQVATARKAVQAAPAVADARCHALVLVDRDREEVDTAYAAEHRPRKGGTTRVSRFDGYSAGRRAGARVALGGGRGAIAGSKQRLGQ